MASFLWQNPKGETESVPIDRAPELVLGRDPAADFVFDVRGISRRHARIVQEGDEYFLEDLGSTNGTLVNGTKLGKRTKLQPGDRIQIGKLTLEFECDQTASGPLVTEPLSRTLRYEKVVASGLDAKQFDFPEKLPRKFSKFELLEKIGQGGMGAVYLAKDSESDRRVAVKMIRAQIGRRESFLQFFHNREAVLAREIDHPNVVQIFEHGVLNDQHYIAMEYIRGDSLYRVMKGRKLDPKQILEILRQVACGLVAAHKQGVVHSDIKPANLIVDEQFFGARNGNVFDGNVQAEDVEAPGILEFGDDATGAVVLSSDDDDDDGLKKEIERRVGDKVSYELLEDPPYFSRPSEMRYLEHYLERLGEGNGFFVLLEGEPGVGKRRLLSQFFLKQRGLHLIDGSGPKFFELDCSRIEGIPLLYQQMANRAPGVDFNLRQTVDEIKQLTESFTSPVVVRLHDLGKATPLVCYLVNGWVRMMSSRPILLIANLDSVAGLENSAVKELIGMSQSQLKALYMRPLTEYQIQRYIELLFPSSSLSADLAVNLYRLSGGNFARLLELLRSFFERGVLNQDFSTGLVHYRPRQRELELEEGKNLYEKYRHYGQVEQRILESAAFIGGRFFFDVLNRFSQIDETALFFLVRQFLADGFLTEQNRTWFRFTNEAFRRYMAERTAPPDRPHQHRRLTRLLQTVSVPESAELLMMRGEHFAGCREYGKSVQCLLEGAHLARNGYQVDLAREMYQEILRIYRELSESETSRHEIREILKRWFRRDGNWYEILGDLSSRSEEAMVRIADFGISFRAEDEERGYAVGKRPIMGTPRYIAPERARGEYGGPYSDIFSLGVIAYEMVVGQPPFPGLNRKKRIEAYQTRPIRLPAKYTKSYPSAFGALVEGMLSIDPARRWDAERVAREVVKLQFEVAARPPS